MGADVLWFDTETFSDVPINRGHHAYFASPHAQIMIAAWAVDDRPVQVEDLTEVRSDGTVRALMCSEELEEHLHTAREIVIHNSPFDRTGPRRT